MHRRNRHLLPLFTLIALGALLGVGPAQAEVELHGFVEAATSVRATDLGAPPAGWPAEATPPVYARDSDFVLRETRLQLKGVMYGDVAEGHFVLDFLADEVRDDTDLEIREGYLKFTTFADHLEVRAGRQPTTWGTGDLLFINDLFPKDWVSFFAGREDQYLKRPSDAVRLGVYGLPFTMDFVYTPQFTPDRTPTGERLAIWAPVPGLTVTPEEDLENGEFALRLNRYVGGLNLSAYGYVGYWKTPQELAFVPGTDPQQYQFRYPEMRSYGASARGALFGGVFWLEGAYYDSHQDADGDDPLIPNSEIRAMAGFERQWWSDFTGNLQFYWEGMQDWDLARSSQDLAFGPGSYLKDENRTLITTRLQQLMFYQNLNLTAFGFWSPSEEDMYVRLSASYAYSDALQLTLGGNIFHGEDHRSMFGMNDANDNVYARLRYSF